MGWQHQRGSMLMAVMLGGLVGVTAVAAAGEQFIPILGVHEQCPTRHCPAGAGYARPDPPTPRSRRARGRRGWAGISVCLHHSDQLLESKHAKLRFIGQRAGGMDQLKGVKIAHIYRDDGYGRDTLPILQTGHPLRLYGATPAHTTARA
jgi:hypothetical protein